MRYLCLIIVKIGEPRQNVSSGGSDQARPNWPAQPQKLARVLKFRLYNLRDIILSKQ